MKKLLLSTAVLALTAGAALAADLSSRKAPILPPPPPPPPLWTGFYAGLNAGYGFGTNNNTGSAAYGNPVPVDDGIDLGSTGLASGFALSGIGPHNQSGFIGGGQVGYNYQWGSNFVLGIEADIQGTGIRGPSHFSNAALESVTYEGGDETTFSNTLGATRVHAGVDWLGTVRGRIGYLFTPTLLAYATGGLTYGGVYANVNNYALATTQTWETGSLEEGPYNHTFVGGGSKSQTLVGWNVGGGLEWMFMPNWSLKAEGIYWNMGSMNVPTFSAAAAPNPSSGVGYASSPASAFGATRVNYQGVIARAGINYHFNFGGSAPIVAKY